MISFPPPEKIRNVGVAGHIDHGKTTMADHILAEAGIIPQSLAGKARFLDYLLEEQKRGITIKTSVITFSISYNNEKYLINLCDTPGHVDFSGKVSRALRLVDGVLIIIDAVEGIMAQTESYLRLALQEAVKPILFINKIDRLINELKLSEPEIFSRLSTIIKHVNYIIEQYAPNELTTTWLISPEKNNVIFGSALHSWGFTYSIAKKRQLLFSDIIRLYKSGQYSKIANTYPLGKTLISSIINEIPNPKDAQKYRVKYLWTNPTPPEFLLKCDDAAPTVFFVAKTNYHQGKIFGTARVFSGKVKTEDYIRLRDKAKVRPSGIFLLKANKYISISDIPAGNIFGILIDSTPGDTFSKSLLNGYFKNLTYTVYPVLAVAVEPKEYSQMSKLLKILEILKVEDPNIEFEISKETGQIIIYGIGELHLEIIIKQINEHIPIYYSEPLVAFKELPKQPINITRDAIELHLRPKKLYTPNENIQDLENEILIHGLSLDKQDAILSIIRESLKTGPRINEPIVSTKISLTIKKYDEAKILEVLMDALTKLDTYILQPYYKFTITVNCEFLGSLLSALIPKNAKIMSTSHQQTLCKILGEIPVIDSLGLANKLRSATRGYASIQLEYVGYRIVPANQEKQIFSYLESRKTKAYKTI